MRHRRGLNAVAIVFLAAAPITAQDSAALDKLLADALRDMHNKAADLYNAGDPNGCYRMFQGGLLTARTVLAHRPDVQQLIDQGLQNADRQASIPFRARALHETIEAVRARLKPAVAVKPADAGTPNTPSNPAPSPMPPASPPPMSPGPTLPMEPTGSPMTPAPAAPAAGASTLWKRLGGEDGVTNIVDKFIILALADKRVNFTRDDKFKLDAAREAELKQKLVAYISSVTEGGTVVPTGGRGLAEVHKGMKITDAEFDVFVNCLKTALETNNVTARDIDELLGKIKETRKDVVESK